MAAAARDHGGVGLQVGDGLSREAQAVRHQVHETGLVPLAVGLGADGQFERALGREPQPGLLAGLTARRLQEAGDAEPPQQAAALRSRLEREAAPATMARIELAYRLLFSRAPTARQSQLAVDFLTADGANEHPTADAWQQYLQALLVSNEFMFID